TEGMQPRASWSALYVRLALKALVRPRLAVDLVRLAWSFRARDWWRRPPFLPLPPRDYMQWRMFTAYGDEHGVQPVEDVVNFGRWRRETMGLEASRSNGERRRWALRPPVSRGSRRIHTPPSSIAGWRPDMPAR